MRGVLTFCSRDTCLKFILCPLQMVGTLCSLPFFRPAGHAKPYSHYHFPWVTNVYCRAGKAALLQTLRAYFGPLEWVANILRVIFTLAPLLVKKLIFES